MGKTDLERLQKEVERLTRRNKILTNRISRMAEENQELIDELAQYEVKKIVSKPKMHICPKCTKKLDEYPGPTNKIVLLCSDFPKCTFRKVI